MFKKKQLKINIEDLDVQIGKLSKELEELEKDNKYEVTMDKLKTLSEIRGNLTRGLKEDETSEAVLEIDKQIEELTAVLALVGRDDIYSDKIAKLEELTKIRCLLSESKVKDSVKPIVVSGLLSIASVAIVLKYEEANVITSKGFEMAKGMFRGSK